MALFVDGPACTSEDLAAQDSGLLDAAQSEGIDVTAKIQLAMEEMTPEIQAWLNKPTSVTNLLWQPAIRIEQVVVTLALKRWQAMHSLALFYRDAYFGQLVERYRVKWEEYTKQASNAKETFVTSGMAIVGSPVHRAEIPGLGSQAGSQPGGTYYAAVSDVGVNGQEGAASLVASIALTDGKAMTVSAPEAPGQWNVYAGTSLAALTLQNSEPLNSGDSWIYISGAGTPARKPCKGQLPDLTIPLVRRWMRG